MSGRRLTVWLLLAGILAGCGGGTPAAERKAEWIRDAYATIASGRYPRLKAVAWWHENFDRVRLRIDSSPAALDAYRSAIADPAFVTEPVIAQGKLQTPSRGVYVAAFPDFCGPEDCVSRARIADFESLAGRPVAWAYFSNNGFDPASGDPRIAFPWAAVETIDAAGRLPFVRLMLRSRLDQGQPDPVYALQAIIDGDFDVELTAWADDASAWGKPLLAEFGTEVNGEWFPWNGLHNGGGTRDGFGDPDRADGPERFVAAYRHIIDLFRSRGVDNITWFFHVNDDSEPVADWNRIARYYPGDNYIDWIGVSIYNGVWVRDEDVDFQDLMDRVWPRLTALSPSRPIALLELGMDEQP